MFNSFATLSFETIYYGRIEMGNFHVKIHDSFNINTSTTFLF